MKLYAPNDFEPTGGCKRQLDLATLTRLRHWTFLQRRRGKVHVDVDRDEVHGGRAVVALGTAMGWTGMQTPLPRLVVAISISPSETIALPPEL